VAAYRQELDPDIESYTPAEKKEIRELKQALRESQAELAFGKKSRSVPWLAAGRER
jgi:hypothetical protein